MHLSMQNQFGLEERAILALGFAKLVLVTWFFFSVFAINAAHASATGELNDITCTGNDLLEKMRIEAPESYTRVEKAAAETPNGQAKYWKVEKEGLPVSYLLGTMHMADPRISILPEDKAAHLNAADTVIIETTEGMDPQEAQETMGKLRHLIMLTDGSTLEEKLPEELHDDLQKAVEERAMPWFMAKRMQPWFVAATIAFPMCEMTRKQNGEKALDFVIAQTALENGQNLVGLETMEEQLTAMATLPAEYHLTSLSDSLKIGAETRDDMMFTMMEMYLNNQVSMFMPMVREIMPTTFDRPEHRQFQKQLIDDRNHIMAERSLEHFEKGGVFMAVGALHLPGGDGLVTLLRNEGYTLTAME